MLLVLLSFQSEMEKMQRVSHDNACKIIKETENMKLELDCKKEQLDRWCKELSEREALTISERRKTAKETKRVIPLRFKFYIGHDET